MPGTDPQRPTSPLGLVLGAPITLVLRSVSPARGRTIGRVLRSSPVHLVANPFVALALNVGGLAVLYFSPLYVATTRNELLHVLVHVHFLLAGCLFAWVVAGPDPAPRRPSVPVRLVVLGLAITAHAVIFQVMYAELFVQVPVPAAQLRGAGELMYYGGDIAELLLAVALLFTWRPRPVRDETARAVDPDGRQPLPARSVLSVRAPSARRFSTRHN
ncbi:cytochrome c oxidase assembly protein [Rhodococcus ruber]|uniref:cytochrome c oxidase assembly protein n=1 Tax=Rhodococcus TaxID=1827 RepID=UPI00029ACE75|nr:MULTISPECIES: cytochrome c oxidase assembly protein [Rhodococcus]ATQ29140.1 cytochrome c oxidase assembly protein [Rhodococcus ruber]QRE82621.1 cytochrome c oxidase assembly protein [Rhodococcus ruber]